VLGPQVGLVEWTDQLLSLAQMWGCLQVWGKWVLSQGWLPMVSGSTVPQQEQNQGVMGLAQPFQDLVQGWGQGWGVL
jgi:hypothetical protein